MSDNPTLADAAAVEEATAVPEETGEKKGKRGKKQKEPKVRNPSRFTGLQLVIWIVTMVFLGSCVIFGYGLFGNADLVVPGVYASMGSALLWCILAVLYNGQHPGGWPYELQDIRA